MATCAVHMQQLQVRGDFLLLDRRAALVLVLLSREAQRRHDIVGPGAPTPRWSRFVRGRPFPVPVSVRHPDVG